MIGLKKREKKKRKKNLASGMCHCNHSRLIGRLEYSVVVTGLHTRWISVIPSTWDLGS